MNPHAIFQKLLMVWFVNYKLSSNRKRFLCLHSLECNMVFGVFEPFRPTRDKVECLHNLWAFSQPLECLYKAMQKQQMVFYSSYKASFSRKIKNSLLLALIKIIISLRSQNVAIKVMHLYHFWFCKKDCIKTDFSCYVKIFRISNFKGMCKCCGSLSSKCRLKSLLHDQRLYSQKGVCTTVHIGSLFCPSDVP